MKGQGDGEENFLDFVDHCTLTQNQKTVYYRYLDNGQIKSDSIIYSGYGGGNIHYIENSTLRGLRASSDTFAIRLGEVENCLFEACAISPLLFVHDQYPTTNSVYLPGDVGVRSRLGNWRFAINECGDVNYDTAITCEEFERKYIPIHISDFDIHGRNQWKYYAYQAVAESLDGTLACINSEEEKEFLQNLNKSYYIGLKYNEDIQKHEWIDDTEYEVGLNVVSPYVYLSKYGFNASYLQDSTYMLIEVPIEKTDEEIYAAIENFDYEAFTKEWGNPFSNNAVLNPLLNAKPEQWSVFTANEYDSAYIPNYLHSNYWGTENEMLINKMITDADDFAGTYQDIIHDPILTLESESLSEIYPFVTQVYLTDEDGNKVSHAQPGETYEVHVHFNRDMDTDEQPSVSYGPAVPYTDFMVDGDFVSDREWVGTTKISKKLTSGTMFFRTKGGCAADDGWLVCGEDVMRFSFDVSTTGVLAMILNAEGGANRVDLSWAQNDYEVLGGYNLYRSTSETTGFKKINTTILSETEYVDTDVEPGVTYYYYFKVVNTDGDEEALVSNTVSATPIDNVKPVLTHSPVTNVKAGSQITISAKITDNIAVTEAKLYYRTGEGEFKEKEMVEGDATAGLYVAVIPASAVTKAGVSYYIEAKDADGNMAHSGTAQLPNVIVVNSDAYISGLTPSKVGVAGGKTVSILGGNFTEDMVLKLGGEQIEFTFVDTGQINFIAPAKASGSYAVTLTTTEGAVVTSSTPLSYTDASSMAQIPTSMTMVSGVPYQIPLYLTASGEVISLHAELDLPTSYFTKVTVEKANVDANFTVEYTYSGGVLKIGCIGTSNINPGDAPLLNIVVTPKVTEDMQYDINLHDVFFNDVEVNTVISGTAQLKPSFVISALVKYFAGTDNFVDGVTISAAGVNGVTDENGAASLTVDEKSVTITANRVEPKYSITAYDASMVLQSAIGKTTLDDNQKLAADVDGNGKVSEYDAALILQKSVKKIDAFPIGKAWIFVPSVIEKTLSATGSNVATFTAISVGDVDGSYPGDAE